MIPAHMGHYISVQFRHPTRYQAQTGLAAAVLVPELEHDLKAYADPKNRQPLGQSIQDDAVAADSP